MKNVLLVIIVLFSCLLITSCSYGDAFMIVNNSDSVLEIEYKWKDDLYSSPYKFKFESFNGEKFEKLESIDSISKEEIENAEAKNEFRIKLEPKQALRIHSVMGQTRENIEKKVDESFHVNYLSLKGNKGNIELTGNQIWFQFHRMKEGYFIVYR